MKYVTVCADDYGLNASVSQGIINLLERKRLSAVSCMTNSAFWRQHAAWLKPFQPQADLGLHFNLTEGQPLSSSYLEKYGKQFFPLSRLIYKAFLRQLDVRIIERECEAQLKAFVGELGFLPDFLDGHQHIHQLPVVRDAVLRVYERYLREKKTYMRSVFNTVKSRGWGAKFKQGIIYLCGAPGFELLLKKYAIPHNAAFAGIYSFPQAAQYAQLFPYFLRQIKDVGLIMCHPGLLAAASPADPIASARFQEYDYFAGHQYERDCQDSGVLVVKLPRPR